MLTEIDQLELVPVAGVDPQKAVNDLLRTALIADAKYVGAYRAWSTLSVRDARLAQIDRQIVDWSADRLAALLAVAAAAPAGRHDIDLPATARLLTLMFWRLLEPDVIDDRTFEALSRMVSHILFTDTS